MPVVGWYFMLIITAAPPIMHAEYMGPYPTQAVCEAAIEGAQQFENAYAAAPLKGIGVRAYEEQHRFQTCTDDPFVWDAQWSEEVDNQRYYDGGGVW